MADDFLAEKIRAEDILLGSLGYGESASIISIEKTPTGYRGLGKWDDGEEFEFECEDELDDLQLWALGILVAK
jgi:hypothetical protein